ncbi:MAG: LacI family DNA-binding transcriptional regulator [Verrucomicrobia bacterium]|nr:LacI family DNA-binding transcriptional regulator [Verrucomicrobiota bacterium]MCH8513107.1 LacI family transcriptional regulator [Kiritimatiellia bacterium]
MKQKTTLQDIADACGVTRMTVSSALRGTGRMREDLREKIVEQAALLGYRPNKAAKIIGTGWFDTVTLLNSVNIERSNLFHDILLGLSLELQEKACHLHVATFTDADLSGEGLLPLFMRESNSDGLIINYTHDVPKAFLDQLALCNIPYVWFNNKRRVDAVYADDLQGGKESVRVLTELGHKRILYLDHPISHHYSVTDRRKGYVREMEARCLKPEVNSTLIELSDREQYLACRKILEKKNRPTAVITYSSSKGVDMMLVAALALGMEIPRDLSLLCFGDVYPTLLGRPISTIIRPTFIMGQEAARMFLAKRSDPEKNIPSVKVPLRPLCDATLAPPSA